MFARILVQIRLRVVAAKRFSSSTMVRILNVAEKNDAAKSIADVMSNGRFRKREGLSVYNKIYEFDFNLMNQNVTMTFTSVSGHLLALEFPQAYRKWHSCSPANLFDIPVQKYCPEDSLNIKRTLEREIQQSQSLIIWTDCDREGENIGFEIIQVCREVKPNIQVYRAKFSEITPQAVTRAVRNLAQPDQLTSDAVDVRTELDLRIGAAFTRFQTLRLTKVFPQALADQLISYGSCQFPTLGFVVERYKQVQAFIPEPFWKLKVTHERDEEAKAEFAWKRNRLFNHMACLILYEQCIENPIATVVDVRSKNKNKWRPVALDTVELEKLASRKLRINAKETMRVAERLYTQGYISYPRTETNIFPKELDLVSLVREQTQDASWGAFAQGILDHGPTPRNGTKTDKAHPPIHPLKYSGNLQGNEQRIYEFIVRHFLACCSQDAVGHETLVEIDVAEERFTAQGLMILAKNYLEVYPYDRWSAKEMPIYHTGDSFEPTTIEMVAGETSPPPLLSEADLISLMEKHGIGTDATHAEHIETIKSRMYVGLRPDSRFVPGQLGMGLVEGYDQMGYEMSKPHLRAELEADLKAICEGRKNKNEVLAEHIRKYREVFLAACQQAMKLDEALAQYLGEAQPYSASQAVSALGIVKPCPRCGQDLSLRTKKDGKGYYLGCSNYPTCRYAVWLPDGVLEASVEQQTCDICQPAGSVHLLRFKFRSGTVPPSIPNSFTGCVGGCDEMLNEALGITHQARTSAATPASRSTNSTTNNTTTQPRAALTNPTTSRSLSTYTGVSQPVSAPPVRGTGRGRGVVAGTASRLPLSVVDSNNTRPGFLGTGSTRGAHGGDQNRRGRGAAGSLSASTRGDQGTTRGVGNSGPGRNTFGTGNGIFRSDMDDGNPDKGLGSAIVCNCGEDAQLLTVRKEGPNTGRQFYKCHKPMGEGCNFFFWADEQSGSSDRTTNVSVAYSANSSTRMPLAPAGDSNVSCHCSMAARKLTVQKEGANRGRQFYSCTKPRGEGCNFFQWAEDVQGGGEQQGSRGDVSGTDTFNSGYTGGGQGRGGRRGGGNMAGQKRKTNSEGNPGAKRPRRCGLCGAEGHNKKNCPHKDS